MTSEHRPRLLVVDDRAGVRCAIRKFIEDTASYTVYEAVDYDLSAIIHKAIEVRCDLILLHLSTPLEDIQVTVSLLRSKLPHVKIVGLTTLSFDLGNQVSTATGFDAVIAQEEGLPKLVETLKALMPEPPRE